MEGYVIRRQYLDNLLFEEAARAADKTIQGFRVRDLLRENGRVCGVRYARKMKKVVWPQRFHNQSQRMNICNVSYLMVQRVVELPGPKSMNFNSFFPEIAGKVLSTETARACDESFHLAFGRNSSFFESNISFASL